MSGPFCDSEPPPWKVRKAKQQKKAKDADYWGEEGDERLTHTDPEDAAREIVERMICDGYGPVQYVEVVGFKKMQPTMRDLPEAGNVIDEWYERLDEEYGDPDGCFEFVTGQAWLDLTAKLEEVQRAFLAAYETWSCEEVCRERFEVPEDWWAENG